MIDIDTGVIASSGSYADDTRVWNSINSVINESNLQVEIDKVYHWSVVNNMQFNSKKFELLSIGTTKRDPQYTTPEGAPISAKTSVKDLGVTFQENLQFKEHILAIVKKGHKMANWALHIFKTRSNSVMLTILKSLVRHQIEYACPLWSPSDQRLINLLENVQRSFTKRFASFQEYNIELGMPVCYKSYPERLHALKIYSAQRRRERYMIIQCYKVVIGMVDNPGFEKISYGPRTKIRISPKFQRSSAGWIKKARAASLFCHGARLYNCLPHHLRELEDIAHPTKQHVLAFKQRLDKHLTTIPDIPGTCTNALCPLL